MYVCCSVSNLLNVIYVKYCQIMNLIRTSLLFCLSLLTLLSCDKINQETHYRTIMPIYEKMSTIRQMSVTLEEPRTIENFGKIYIYKDFLFINEPLKGIHIYDNSNPSQPYSVTFLNIPGNVDMAVKDNVLYADSYVDLLSFDLSVPTKPQLVHRNEDVFKSVYRYNYETKSLTDIILRYVDTVLTHAEVDKYSPFLKKEDKVFMDYYYSANYSSGGNTSGNSGSTYGQGGSMARFTLAKEHLYTVDDRNLNLFNVSITKKPTFTKTINLGWGIETIFPYKNNLFIGSNAGMYIYNIDKPSDPVELSRYEHLRACDPVVVNDKYAFVTLRSGAACGGVQNVLEVVDIQNLKAPKLVKSYQMKNPHGLGLYNNMLYLCEGEFGFKSFDISDVTAIDQHAVENIENLKSTDVIVGPKSMIIIGPDGVCQYDYSNSKKIKLLSCINLNVPH